MLHTPGVSQTHANVGASPVGLGEAHPMGAGMVTPFGCWIAAAVFASKRNKAPARTDVRRRMAVPEC